MIDCMSGLHIHVPLCYNMNICNIAVDLCEGLSSDLVHLGGGKLGGDCYSCGFAICLCSSVLII